MNIAFCLLFAAVASAATCKFTSGTAVTYDSVLDCFNSVPMQKETFEQSMDTIQRAAKLYVFRDIAKSSPAPVFIPMKIDLDAELEKIRRKSYTKEFPFHTDITTLFTRFHDGHLAYVPPSCYTSFTAIQPFVLVSYLNETSSTEEIFVADIVSKANDAYKSLYNSEDLTKYIGWTVTSINDIPAVKEIFRFANESIGSTHCVNGRYNQAVARFAATGGYYLGKYFSRSITSKIPKSGESIKYTLTNGKQTKTLSFKWVSIPSASYDDQNAFIAACQQRKMQMKTVENGLFDEKMIDEMPHAELSLAARRVHFQRNQNRKTTNKQNLEITPLVVVDDIQFYQIGADAAVIHVPDFSPDKRAEFVRALRRGFDVMAEKNLTRVVIDLSNNGGGVICLGYTLARMLIPEYQPYGANDMPVVPLSLAYAKSAIENNVKDTYWSPNFWYKMNSNETHAFNLDWFSPGVKHTRGGVVGNYSQLFRDSCDLYFDNFNPPRIFKPSQIKILTNGNCGSTCALFSRHLQEYQKVMTYAIGGITNVPMAIANCPGGQVNNIDTTVEHAKKLKMENDPLSPPGFPNTAQMTYTLREVYPWQKTKRDIPLEYFFQPATFHLPYTKESSIDPQKTWQQVMEYFD